jgi:LuxR family transcriptional regulator
VYRRAFAREEIELRLQMLVQMALTSLMRFEDGMVMPPK